MADNQSAFSLDVEANELEEKRHKHDVYETPRMMALEIAKDFAARTPTPKHVLVPWCGSGAFVWALRQVYGSSVFITACDYRGVCAKDAMAAGATAFEQLDWRSEGAPVRLADMQLRAGGPFDAILDNPPWDQLVKDLTLAIVTARHVGVLLRMSQWWAPEGLKVLKLPGRKDTTPTYPRPVYSGEAGTDMVGSGVFHWQRGYVGPVEEREVLIWRNDPKRQQQLF